MSKCRVVFFMEYTGVSKKVIFDPGNLFTVAIISLYSFTVLSISSSSLAEKYFPLFLELKSQVPSHTYSHISPWLMICRDIVLLMYRALSFVFAPPFDNHTSCFSVVSAAYFSMSPLLSVRITGWYILVPSGADLRLLMYFLRLLSVMSVLHVYSIAWSTHADCSMCVMFNYIVELHSIGLAR